MTAGSREGRLGALLTFIFHCPCKITIFTAIIGKNNSGVLPPLQQGLQVLLQPQIHPKVLPFKTQIDNLHP